MFVKPDKIYLSNTNLHYAYRNSSNAGAAIREVFMVSMVSQSRTIQTAKKEDLLVNNKYTLEVGSKNKKYKQIKDMPNLFVVADDIEVGSGNKVPMWLFGFLNSPF